MLQVLCLCHLYHLRGFFFDTDVHQTREYLAWYVFIYIFAPFTLIYQLCCLFYFLNISRLESNSEFANRVNAEIVTKAETATIGELLTYMKQEGAKVRHLMLLYLHWN